MSPFVIPIVALLIPIIVIPVVLGLKFARFQRELEHAERMKALEMGCTLPRDETYWHPARIAVTIGAGVPIGVFTCALISTESSGFRQDVWMSSMVVGLTSVICGTVLAARHFNHRAENERIATLRTVSKPVFEEDAFDVVGSRG